MKDVLKIAGAFVGFLVGAGFASGQELLQFFVSFGVWGLAGIALSTAAFILLGMTLANLGSELQATSHKEVVRAICGPWLSKPIDLLMTFFMFAIAVVMLAGAGVLLEQKLGLPAAWGSALVTLLVIAATCLKLKKVLTLISSITPLLILVALGIAIYALATQETDLTTLNQLALEQNAATSHWALGAMLYVSYNIFGCVAILAISSGAAKDRRKATWGGILGGITLGALMMTISLAMLSRLDSLVDTPMPMLALALEVSPALSSLVSIVILLMIFNTAVGCLYSFSSRFLQADTTSFRVGSLIAGIIAYACSMFGFVSLVGMVYPVFGYIGFILITAITVAWVRQRMKHSHKAQTARVQ